MPLGAFGLWQWVFRISARRFCTRCTKLDFISHSIPIVPPQKEQGATNMSANRSKIRNTAHLQQDEKRRFCLVADAIAPSRTLSYDELVFIYIVYTDPANSCFTDGYECRQTLFSSTIPTRCLHADVRDKRRAAISSPKTMKKDVNNLHRIKSDNQWFATREM